MLLLSIVFILLVIIYIIRISNNKDIIQKNKKTDEDKAYIKKIKKKEHTNIISTIFFISAIVALTVIILCDYTSIDYVIADYFAESFIEEKELNKLLYFIPAYILIVNLVYIQVRIGDKLLTYFKTIEEELKLNINIDKEKLLGLIYKKKTSSEETKKTEE